MIDSDEVVETSDVEELEEAEAQRMHLPQVRSSSVLGTRHLTENPRKKIRLSDDAPFYGLLLSSPQSSGTYRGITPKSEILSSPSRTVSLPHSRPSIVEERLKEQEGHIVTIGNPQIPDSSQDPLLLRSPSSSLNDVYLLPEDKDAPSFPGSRSTSPRVKPGQVTISAGSPPHSHYPTSLDNLQSVDAPLLSNDRPSPSLAKTLKATAYSVSDSYDDLLVFSPVKPSSPLVVSSPLTPVSIRYVHNASSRDPTPDIDQRSSPSPSMNRGSASTTLSMRSPSLQRPRGNQLSGPSTQVTSEISEHVRYPLRPRKPDQQNPFTRENQKYKALLRHMPEAIVRNKALEARHYHPHPHDNYIEDEEMQQDDDDREWEKQQNRKRRLEEQQLRVEEERRSSTQRREYADLPELLREPLSSDDDEEINKTRKEARRFLRQEEQRKKEEEQERRKEQKVNKLPKAKRFPLANTSHPQRTIFNGVNVTDSENENNESTTVKRKDKARKTSNAQANGASLSLDEGHILHGYFDEYDDLFDEPDPVHPMVFKQGLPVNDQPTTPPVFSILRNTYETAIHVDPGEDNASEEVGPEPELGRLPSRSSHTPQPIDLDLSPGRKRALNRMIPHFMISKLVDGERQKGRQKKNNERDIARTTFQDGPLLPGRTRVQIVAQTKDMKDIRGDTESEEDDDNHRVDSTSDVSDQDEIVQLFHRELSPQIKNRKAKLLKEVDLDLSESDGASNNTDKVHIFRKGRRRKGAIRRLQDPGAIDYMLQTTESKRAKKSHNSRNHFTTSDREPISKFQYDIVTAGGRAHGRSKQSTLTFTKERKRTHRSSKLVSNSSHATSMAVSDAEESENNLEYTHEIPSELDRKIKRKKAIKHRKENLRNNGVYTISRKNQFITTGRSRQTAFITLDLEDDDFHRALDPTISDSEHKHFNSGKEARAHIIDLSEDTEKDIPIENVLNGKAKLSEIPSDFRISVLSSGRCFDPSMYIVKGWLEDAVQVAFEAKEPTVPHSLEMLGFGLNVDMGIENFCFLLPNIYDSLLDFITSLPDPDEVTLNNQWSNFLRSVSQFVSWSLNNSGDDDSQILREKVEKEILQLVGRIQQLDLRYINNHILIACRFLMDISARTCKQPTMETAGIIPEPLKTVANLTIRNLLLLGVDRLVETLINDSPLNGSEESHLGAELWVCSMYFLNKCTMKTGATSSKDSKHPFWSILIDNLRTMFSGNDLGNGYKSRFQKSEDCWRIIFVICTLSRFSIHGMALEFSCLPSCWDVVVFALGIVRLTGALLGDRVSQAEKRRSKYIALLTVRCFQLQNTWKWSLSNAFPMFRVLTEVFKSRSFANLLHEGSDFPEFFRQANWDLLSDFEERDTAYSVFLKLVYRASQNLGSSPWIKKLISLAIPISALSFTKNNPPHKRDLPKLFNRFAAAAITGDLDRSACDQKIVKARTYVQFSAADHLSRIAIIRGVKNWACLLVDRGMNLVAIADWVDEIARVLANEERNSGAEHSSNPEARSLFKPNILENIALLLGAINSVFESCYTHGRYPDPILLLRMRPILRIVKELSASYHTHPSKEGGTFERDVGMYFSKMAQEMFKARIRALPPPTRPFIPEVQPMTVQEESQDTQQYDYDDLNDINWDAEDIPDNLKPPSNVSLPVDILRLEKDLREAIKSCNLKWLIYSYLEPLLVNAESRASDRDLWSYLWLNSACLEAETDSTAWSSYFEVLDKTLAKLQKVDSWVRSIEMSTMFQVIQLHPMSYLDSKIRDRALKVFLVALTSERNIFEKDGTNSDTRIERRYVELLLSIDCLKHYLFKGVDCLPVRKHGTDYEFSPDKLLEFQIPLLKTVFRNIENSIISQRNGLPDLKADNDKYIEWCRHMFSAMRNNRNQAIPDKLSDKFKQYTDLCHKVIEALTECKELSLRLPFWSTEWVGLLKQPS